MQGMKRYGDNFIPVIPVASESMTHSVERPVCTDMTCPCQKTNLPLFAHCEALSEEERAYVFFEGLERVLEVSSNRPKQGYYYSDKTHSVALPFCNDPKCWRHEDPDLIAVINAAYLAGEVTSQEATNIIAGKTF